MELELSEELTSLPNVMESKLYDRLGGDRVRCRVCERRCVIPLGERGFCRTRGNIGGKLYTLVYGDLSAVESRPIEIKPFFHYWPGSTALTFSTWSCNFTCPWCQNWTLSRVEPDPLSASYVSPEALVREALRRGDEGLCVSFNEPTMLFEYSLDVFRLGRERGLYACYVSNGYMTAEALEMLREAGMDGLKVDVKGTQEVYDEYIAGAKVDYVWRNAKLALRMGMHVEVVFLIITGVSDDEAVIEEVVERHVKELGPDVPIHFTRYFPAYQFTNPPTDVRVLERAYEVARRAGVKFPYVGNVMGHRGEHTYCPNCGYPVIKRFNWRIVRYRLDESNRCPKCGAEIPIRGRHVKKVRLFL